MITNCHHCKKEFDCPNRKYNSNTKLGLNIYCSSECYNNYKKRNSVVGTCSNCGKEISKPKTQQLRSKTGNLYCSRSCSASKNNTLFKKWENHPSFKTGLNGYRDKKLKSVENPKCEICGFNNVLALEIHHKDKNRKNNNLNNLEILCCNCHTIKHRTIENVV